MFTDYRDLLKKHASELNVHVDVTYNLENASKEKNTIIYHLVSNSIAHCGLNECSISVTEKNNIICVTDDGLGLDFFKIIQLNNMKGVLSFADFSTAILKDGFTVSRKKGSVSGHGRGLGECEKLGEVIIHEVKEGFKISVDLNKKLKKDYQL